MKVYTETGHRTDCDCCGYITTGPSELEHEINLVIIRVRMEMVKFCKECFDQTVADVNDQLILDKVK